MNTNIKAKRPDFILSIPVVILIGFGLVMVYSASTEVSRELYNDSSRIFFKQLVALGIGVPVLLATMFIPHDFYRRKSVLFLSVLFLLVLLGGVLFQSEAKGAVRWYRFMSFGFQPSALALVVTIMLVSAYATAFERTRDMWIRRLRIIGPYLILVCGLILAQNDFGTTMIILSISGLVLFLAGIPTRILVLGGVLLLPIMVGLVVTKPYRLQRIKSFLAEPHYQVVHSKLAIGSGGVTGVGLAQGKQKLGYLPEPHTDFIFSTLCEEFGLVGACALLLCYLFFLLRGIYVLNRVESPWPNYSRVLGGGLLMLLTLQAMLNISVAMGLFPNKGLTLPFISAGGTSLIVSLAIAGILLNISRWQRVENRRLGNTDSDAD